MGDAREEHDNPSGKDESLPTVSFPGLAEQAVEQVGSQVGPYKLLSVLGEGGFGMVYSAEQNHPIQRLVALKVIKPGMDTKQVTARFESERQALALLDHPNIAQVYDAGTTEAGRPYFVMEHIRGAPITKHCDEQKLSIEERLELFMQVCDGVQHAHQKGIIHRDIKPSNILVVIDEKKAVPKIIDFGVAKALTQPLTERTLFTKQGQLIGTPEYMSPEQAAATAQDIDTRSDIYSLGVLLYELLTGALPFDRKKLEQGGVAEILRIIREEDLPHPSARLSSLGEEAETVAKNRRTQVAALAKRLHKELEWIPLKAMRKEKSHRYQSALNLADDIQNYLSGVPLIAGPESMVYRLSKFVRRNRALVTGVAAVLIVLIAGAIVSSLFAIGQARARAAEANQRQEAERQAKISQAVSQFLTIDLLASVDPARARGREITVREVLDATSEKLEGKFAEEPLIDASLRFLLGSMYGKLGEYKAGEQHLKRALQTCQRQLGEQHPDTLATMNNMAIVYWRQGRYDEAETLCDKTLQLRGRVLGEQHQDTLTSMHDLATIYFYQGRYDEAESLHVKTLELRRRVLGQEHRDTLASMGSLANLYRSQSRYDEAESLFVESLETMKRIFGEDHPETLVEMNNLAVLYGEQGRYEEAEQLYVTILEIKRRVLGEDHPETLPAMNGLAALYCHQGRYDKAEPMYVKGLETSKRVLGEEHPSTLHHMNNLAELYRYQNRYDEAESLHLKTLEIRKRVLGVEHPDTLFSIHNLAVTYGTQGRHDEAEPLYVEGLETSKRILGQEHRTTLSFMHSLATLYGNRGRYDEAEPLYIKVLEIEKRVFKEENPLTAGSMHSLAALYYAQRRYEEAEPLLLKALEIRRRVLGEEHPNTLSSAYALPRLYYAQGRYDEAEPLYVNALDIRKRLLGEKHEQTIYTMNELALTYEGQGLYDKAESLLLKALEIGRPKLGADHPHTLLYMTNLAHQYYRQGRYDAAEPLYLEALDGRHQVLGEDHPDTIHSLENLLNLYKAWGKPQQAKQWRAKLAQARLPQPPDGAKLRSLLGVKLRWTPGREVVKQSIYFGKDPNNLGLLETLGRTNEFELLELNEQRRYFWRIDGVKSDGSVIKGNVWSFSIGGLVGWWKFDETEGHIAVDSSSFGHHSRLVGGPRWQPGQLGGGLSFDGKDDFANTNVTASQLGIGGNSPRTVAMWVFVRSFNHGGIFEMGNYWHGCNFSLKTLGTDNSYRIQYYGDGFDHDIMVDSKNKWVHLALVHDGSKTKLYANAELVVDINRNLNTGDSGKLVLGRWWKRHYDGCIDDFRIYNCALNEDEIKALYNAATPQTR